MFIKYDFVKGKNEAEPRAQGGLTLTSEALKPSNLLWHLETWHPMLVEKMVDYLREKKMGCRHTERACQAKTKIAEAIHQIHLQIKRLFRVAPFFRYDKI